MKKISGTAEVSIEYTKWHGGRATHVGVTLAFDASQPSAFASMVNWPDGAHYEQVIKDSVLQTIAEQFGTTDKIAVILKRIVWDEVNNNENGFRRASVSATSAALSVLAANAL